MPIGISWAEFVASNPAAATAWATQAELDAAIAAIGGTPTPSLGALTFDPSPGGRSKILPNNSGGVAGVRQECSVWRVGTTYHMIYTAGAPHLYYASCTADPLIPANWTLNTTAVIGGGNGGEAGVARRSCVMVEGTTLYCYYVAADDWYVATAPISTPTVWTHVGKVYDRTDSTTFSDPGNVFCIKSGSTYHLFVEGLYFDGTYVMWHTGVCTSTSPTTGFGAITMLNSLRTGTETVKGSVSGIWIGRDDATSNWVAYYHSEEWAQSLPDNIYRATTTSLTTDAWTIGNNGHPVVRRAAVEEVDQVSDPFLVQAPDGSWLLFWEGFDNRAMKASIFAMKGQRWAPAGGETAHLYTSDHIQWSPVVGSAIVETGTWISDYVAGNMHAARFYNSSNALNDAFEISVVLRPGQWQLELYYMSHPSGGIITFDVDNGGAIYSVTAMAALDTYHASGLSNQTGLRTINIRGREVIRRRLRCKVTAKNASSGGHFAMIQAINLTRLGDVT